MAQPLRGTPSEANASFRSSSFLHNQMLSTKASPSPSRSSIMTSAEQLHDPVSSMGSSHQNYNAAAGVTNNNKDIDLSRLNKHLVPQEDTLKLQGGDVARNIYHQLDNVTGGILINGGSNISSAIGFDKRRTRSSSFSTYLSETRRASTASDINVPGGFRREFLINKSLQENKQPPNFLTANFVEFLSIYGHFAGEDLSDDDDAKLSLYYDDEENALVDEESLLLQGRSHHPNQYVYPPPPPPLKKSHKRKKAETQGKTSIAKTYFLVFKALVGSGVLFLPRAFYNGGLLFSILALSSFGFLTFLCYYLLVQLKHILKLQSFGELGFKTYGKPLRYLILFSIIALQFGFVAIYLLFTSENLIFFSQNFLKWNSPYITTANIVLVQCLLLIPLALIRKIGKLSVISLISLVFIVLGLGIIYYYSGLQLFEYGVGPNIIQFNPLLWLMLVGVAVTSFEGIGLILPIEASMADPSRFTEVLSVSMFVITMLFVSIGTIGYTAYGENVKTIIIGNLPQSLTAVQSIQLLYSLAVFLTAPLQLFPVSRIVELNVFNSKFFSSRDGDNRQDEDGKLFRALGKYNSNVKWLKNLMRASIVVSISLIAYFNAKNVDKFVSFNGCFSCIPLVYIYPPMIHLKTYAVDKQDTFKGRVMKIADYVIATIGIVVLVYSTYQILFLN